MRYQYEYDRSLKKYSFTIELDKVGVDDNFNKSSDNLEKFERVSTLLNAIEELNLIVKGNMDNAEPVFIVGGIGSVKTHYFDNVLKTKKGSLVITEDLKVRIAKGYRVALLKGDNFNNENEIIEELKPLSITSFFSDLQRQVRGYYEVPEN